MKAILFGILFCFVGSIMFVYAVYNILLTIYNYHVIVPTSITEFINYYFGETFVSINDILFLGVFGAIGAILFYFGLFIVYLFKK